MKLKRSTVIPVILLIYLAVMVVLGWPDYVRGATSPALYFGGTALTIGVIILLHFNLKKREEYRKRRQDDMARRDRTNHEN